MCKVIICLFWAFLTLNQLGFLAGSQNNPCSMCIFPNTSFECSKFVSKCLLHFNGDLKLKNFLKLNENQDQFETFLKKIQNKRETQQKVTKFLQKLIPKNLLDRLDKIDKRQQLLQNTIEIQNKIFQKNMKIQQISNQQMLKTIQKLIFQAIKQSLIKIKTQVSASQKDIQFQLTKMSKILSKIEALQRFQPIGLKFYYIEDNVTQNWTTAAETCRQMGGNLASIQNNQEFQVVKRNISPDHVYWVDINDHERKGEFISEASGKRVTFFRWLPGEPRYDDDTQRYVNLFNGGMRVENGSINRYFICQYDDED